MSFALMSASVIIAAFVQGSTGVVFVLIVAPVVSLLAPQLPTVDEDGPNSVERRRIAYLSRHTGSQTASSPCSARPRFGAGLSRCASSRSRVSP
jgi:hypothetical protein